MEKEIVFSTEQEYKEAKRKHDAYHEATMKYCKENKTNGIPTEICATFPFANEVTNALRSALEVWEFIHDIPKKYFLYINQEKGTATTWTGQKLGTVSFGTPSRSNFGDVRIPINVYAINGKKYYGTYYKGAGDYARITLFKNQ